MNYKNELQRECDALLDELQIARDPTLMGNIILPEYIRFKDYDDVSKYINDINEKMKNKGFMNFFLAMRSKRDFFIHNIDCTVISVTVLDGFIKYINEIPKYIFHINTEEKLSGQTDKTIRFFIKLLNS